MPEKTASEVVEKKPARRPAPAAAPAAAPAPAPAAPAERSWSVTYQGGESYTRGDVTFLKGVARIVTDADLAAFLQDRPGFFVRERK